MDVDAAKRAIRAAGLEPAAKRVLQLTENRSQRQNRRDDAALALMLAMTLRPDDSCIDVGAHAGDVLREMVRLAPQGRHIAFEPIPAFAEKLRLEFPGVDVRPTATGAEEARVEFDYVVSRPAVSSLKYTRASEGETVQRIEVAVERIDDVVEVPPRVIKIDVEGAEEGTLRGAIETLASARPLVVLEHGTSAHDHGSKSETIFDLLTSADLRVFSLSGRGPYSRQEFLETVEDGSIWNFAAH